MHGDVDGKPDSLHGREQQLGLRPRELRLLRHRADRQERLIADGFVAGDDQVIVLAADNGVAVPHPVRLARLEDRFAVVGLDDQRVRAPPLIQLGLGDVPDRRAPQQPLHLARRGPLGGGQRGTDAVQQARFLVDERVELATADRLGRSEADRIVDLANEFVERPPDAARGPAGAALAQAQEDLRQVGLHAGEMALVRRKPRAPRGGILVALVDEVNGLVHVLLGGVAALHAPDREVRLRAQRETGHRPQPRPLVLVGQQRVGDLRQPEQRRRLAAAAEQHVSARIAQRHRP